MRRLQSVQKAFDDLQFGPTRILNLREGLPRGDEAVRRADGWLRAKQLEHAGEVLVVTGRGNSSIDGIPVIREEIRRLLTRLRRKGVVSTTREHTPGSFAVTLAPLGSLIDAPGRQRETKDSAPTPSVDPVELSALSTYTRAALQRLAECAIGDLGIREATATVVEREMLRQFQSLTQRIPKSELAENALLAAINRAQATFDDPSD